MIGFDTEIEFAILNSNLVTGAVHLVEQVWRACTIQLITVLFFVASAVGANAQTIVEVAADSDGVTYLSDRYWIGGRDQPVLVETAGDSRFSPRVAFRDAVHALSSSTLTLAQNAQPTPGQSELPILPPPANATPAPPMGETAAPTVGPTVSTPNDPNGGLPVPPQEKLTTELETEFKKIVEEDKKKDEKKEKPAIPDLAKGLLIAQNDGDLTFKPGLRIQPRYMHDDGNGNNDFFIRRFRLKASGSAYGVAKYGLELKIDNEGRFAATPAARAENAWLEFPVVEDEMYLRAGLYDVPMSRDALTSDSKLLFMDRTLIKEQLTAVGMADNTFGLLLHGRPYCGQFEYAFGIFDNDVYERFGIAGTRETDQLMPAGRFVWNVLDPMTPPDGYADYMESYLGKGERLEIGINAAHVGNAIDGLTVLDDITAWGVDIFANYSHYTFQAEYDQIIENIAGAADIISDGWYVQFGYLFDPCDPCTEFAVRYETLDPIIGDDRLDWFRVGFNFYIREHNLKIQTDYCFRSGNTLTAPLVGGLGLFDEDVFEVQLQLDF
jgi:hypothetical protein